MKNKIIIVLLCLACGLCSSTQTDSSRKKSVGKTMAISIDSNYYTQNIFYNPYKKVENKDSEVSIWISNENPSSEKPKAKTLEPEEIAKEIYNLSRSGLRGNSEKLMKYVNMIDSKNVGRVVNTYMNTYGESMFGAVMRNMFISSDTRAIALRYIKDMFIQQSKRLGIYADDIDKLVDGHIEYEKNKFGRMKSKEIDRDLIRILTARYNQASKGNTLYPANGKIDNEFIQGKDLGDCWLLAAIKALNIHPKGLEMLEDLISVDDKGNVTVQLKGVNKEYTISKEELEGANEFAQGDLDVRAIEIAVNKYLHEIVDHTTKLKKIKNMVSKGANIYFDIIQGMPDLCAAYYILFGEEYCLDEKPSNETIENIKTGNYSTLVSSWNSCKLNGYAKHHAYAVTGADDNYVYLYDPNNPETAITISHEEFIRFFDNSYSMKF